MILRAIIDHLPFSIKTIELYKLGKKESSISSAMPTKTLNLSKAFAIEFDNSSNIWYCFLIRSFFYSKSFGGYPNSDNSGVRTKSAEFSKAFDEIL